MANFFPLTCLANTLVITKVNPGGIIVCGEDFKARLKGVDVPDLDEKLGEEIFLFCKQELEGKKVAAFTYTLDNTAAGIVYDKDGYAFMKIGCGKDFSTDFSALLLQKGYAKIDTRFPIPELESYRQLEKEARDKKIGIWADADDKSSE